MCLYTITFPDCTLQRCNQCTVAWISPLLRLVVFALSRYGQSRVAFGKTVLGFLHIQACMQALIPHPLRIQLGWVYSSFCICSGFLYSKLLPNTTSSPPRKPRRTQLGPVP